METTFDSKVKERVIYMITNEVNNKKYIGRTSNFENRRYSHLIDLKSNRHANRLLQGDFNKCGVSAFSFSVLSKFEGTLKQADLKEKELIKKYKTSKDGYNLLGRKEKPHMKQLFAKVDKEIHNIILTDMKKRNLSITDWTREAVMEKLKREDLI